MHNTLHSNLAEVEAKKQGNRVRDVQTQEFSVTLSDRLPKVKTRKVGEILTDLKAAPPVLTRFPTLAVIKPGFPSAHPACTGQASGQNATRHASKENMTRHLPHTRRS